MEQTSKTSPKSVRRGAETGSSETPRDIVLYYRRYKAEQHLHECQREGKCLMNAVKYLVEGSALLIREGRQIKESKIAREA